MVESRLLLCFRCDDPSKLAEKRAKQKKKIPLSKQHQKFGSLGKNCKCKMHIEHYKIFADKDCHKLRRSIVVIKDSLLSLHAERLNWHNRLCTKFIPPELLKQANIHALLPRPCFRKAIHNYIGKYSSNRPDETGLTELQKDVKERLGIKINLDDPVYCPGREKLDYLWSRNCLDRMGSTENDQANLVQLLKEFQADDKSYDVADLLFYQPFKDKSDDKKDDYDPFIFIYQNQSMRRLFERYGRVCVIDATHSTNKYQFKSYAIVILDNQRRVRVGAMFICQHGDEVELHVTKTLMHLKNANKQWQPQMFLSDFHSAQMNAIKSVWSDIFVFLCWIHQNRNWSKCINTFASNTTDFECVYEN